MKVQIVEFDAKSYWEKRLQNNWGLGGVGHIGYGVYYNRWLYKVRKKVFNYYIRSLNLNFEQSRVLDIGSGTGFYLDIWKSLRVKSVTGSDITKVSVKRLKKLYPEFSIVRLDIGSSLVEQNFFEDKFDIATAFDVLFHIVDDKKFRKAIFNISQLLVSGGYFIFSDNFLHSKTIKNTHEVDRSIEEISGILEDAGFRIVKRVPMFVLMNIPVDTRRNWPSLLWRLLMSPVRIFNVLGFLYGVILFPLEILLIRVSKESPSTEMMICQKMRQLI